MPATRKRAKTARRPAHDLEEMRPQHFIIHNPAVRQLIKTEGTINGNRFDLTSHRRDGMLARLREQGFHVLTIDSLINTLPDLAPADAPGAFCWYRGRSKDRYRFFHPTQLTWTAPETVHNSNAADPTEQRLLLRTGWIVLRRRSGAVTSYFQVGCDATGSATLTPLDETTALLHGFAQAALTPPPPLKVACTNDQLQLPDIPLPQPHQAILARLGQHTKATGWQVTATYWPFVQRLFAKLGLRLRRQ